MRLIDADALSKKLLVTTIFIKDGAVFQRMINDAPTIDAVEVVRCKDCRFYLQSNEKCELVDTRLHFYETDKTWTGDCYCSWGERSE